MIHYTKEGEYLKIGLNFRFTAGGFTALWVWYDVAARALLIRRLRFRYHIRPWFLRSKTTHNVVQGYLDQHDLEVVNREILQDLREVQDNLKRRTSNYSLIKPDVLRERGL